MGCERINWETAIRLCRQRVHRNACQTHGIEASGRLEGCATEDNWHTTRCGHCAVASNRQLREQESMWASHRSQPYVTSSNGLRGELGLSQDLGGQLHFIRPYSSSTKGEEVTKSRCCHLSCRLRGRRDGLAARSAGCSSRGPLLAATWWFTTICNTSSRESEASMGIRPSMRAKHPYKYNY